MFITLRSDHDGLPVLIAVEALQSCVEWPTYTTLIFKLTDHAQSGFKVKEKAAEIESLIKQAWIDYNALDKGSK